MMVDDVIEEDGMLADEVRDQLVRLGAKNVGKPLPALLAKHSLPGNLVEWFRYEWPPERHYKMPEDEEYETIGADILDLNFADPSLQMISYIPNTEPYAMVAIAVDGSGFLACVSCKDPNPADPTVWYFDSEGEFFPEHHNRGRLSAFLKELIVA